MESVVAHLRPNAGNGLWLATLVPLCYCINYFKYTRILEFQFVFSVIIAVGLFVQSLLMFHDIGLLFHSKNTVQGGISKWMISRTASGGLPAIAVWWFMEQSVCLSLFTGFTWTLLYEQSFWYTLRTLPGSFTLGEAAIVTQGVSLFLLNGFLRLIDYARHPATSSMQQMGVIVQLTLLGTAVIVGTLHLARPLRSILFYPLCLVVGGIVMAFPVAFDAKDGSARSTAIATLVWFIVGDRERVFWLTLIVGLLGATVVGVAWFVRGGRSSSTRTRKYFHLLIVLVFVPGLLYQCTLLYVSAGMLLAVFVLLEAARLVRLWPIHEVLQSVVGTFMDEKDAGGFVVLTPVYLLVGCAMPLWLHPCGCDLGDWAGSGQVMAMSAGVLSVGIGDAAASVFGSMYGRHKWTAGGVKSFEGTICSVLAQALVVPFFMYMGVFQPTSLKLITFAAAIVVNSLVEATTDQIDNLVLPLITYAILILA